MNTATELFVVVDELEVALSQLFELAKLCQAYDLVVGCLLLLLFAIMFAQRARAVGIVPAALKCLPSAHRADRPELVQGLPCSRFLSGQRVYTPLVFAIVWTRTLQGLEMAEALLVAILHLAPRILHELQLRKQRQGYLLEGPRFLGEERQLWDPALVIAQEAGGERVFEIWLEDGLLER